MFDSLADRMKEDDKRETNSTERVVRYVIMAVISLVLVGGGLYFGVRLLEQ